MNANSRKTYTVKEVSKLSNVSVRALRFYDEIGLLKPAFYGENGYRYYEKAQLLILQQILFYRELGFELAAIQKILADPEFDQAAALKAHRETLVKEATRTESLISTIDKTLAFLERKVPMKAEEIYLGFEKEIIERWGDPARETLEESKRRTQTWTKEDYDKVKQDYDELHQTFAQAITRGSKPGDNEVQALVKRHFSVVNRFWTPNRQSYIGLGKMYCEHPEFRKMYEAFHPKLAAFLAEAMKIYADCNL